MSAEISKLSVACELLESALIMYYRGDSYFATLHLAGAAEELFAAYLTRQGCKSAFESMRTDGVDLANALSTHDPAMTAKDMAGLMNHGKNRTKHMDSVGDDVIGFEPLEEARDVLDRAVSDYYQLMNHYSLPETDLVGRFNRDLMQS